MGKSGFRFYLFRAAILVLIPPLLLVCIAILAQAPSQAATAQRQTETPLQWPRQPQGSERCILCHRGEVEGYAKSAMAHSLRRAGKEPEGSVTTADAKITVSNKENGYWQQLESGGQTTNYRIDYVIGSGNHAAGYLLDLAGHLFQSPIASFQLSPHLSSSVSPL